MKISSLPLLAGFVAIAGLAACSPQPASDASTQASSPAAPVAPAADGSMAPAPAPAPSASSSPAGGRTLALEGFGDLVIGAKVPATSSFKLRGAQASDTCLLYSSPDHPGMYAIVEGDVLRRITVARTSKVRLVEGIGVGSSEKDVLAAFPGFKAEPHEYIAAPGKYLTQPGNDPRLRFEIGTDGKVTDIHVGMAPQLLYVEGCA